MGEQETRGGGCLCGAIRYTAPAKPASVVVCHCRDCQKQAGSAFSIIAVYPRNDIRVEGTPAVYLGQGESGATVERHFCGACGSPIFSDNQVMRDRGILAVKAGTLDAVDDLAPAAHCWTRSKQAWVALPDGIPLRERD